MRLRLTTLTIVGLMGIFAIVALADNHSKGKADMVQMVEVGKKAPDFKLMDASGKAYSLSDYRGKFVVLEWVNFGCPFVKKHYDSGNMQMLQSNYAKKDVVWLSICSSAPGKQGYYNGKELTNAIKDHKVNSAAYLIDAEGEIGRMYQAKTTPNMYVINPKGILIYSGAIDDRPSVKIEDIKGSTNYVTAALDQAMNGKEVKIKTTQPYGCSVKYTGK